MGMESRNIYHDIAERTDGDIYIGVVGPVRNRQIHLYQTLYGNLGAAQHRQPVPPGAGH